MNELLFLVQGVIIGFAMAVPVGPVGIMCIRKTLAEGHFKGLVIGIGAATADAFYGSLAAFGLTFISDGISANQFWFRLIGGSVLLFLGMRTYYATPKDPKIQLESTGIVRLYVYSFLLVITNPVTVFAFIAVFAAFGLGHALNFVSASLLVVGVFLGSGLWFLTLSYIATQFRDKLDKDGFRWVNRIAGILILISAVIALAGVL
jgi:threonine/homoserine/homoserine lactone efflux protein